MGADLIGYSFAAAYWGVGLPLFSLDPAPPLYLHNNPANKIICYDTHQVSPSH